MGAWADKREREVKEAVREITFLHPYLAPDPDFQNDVQVNDALTSIYNELMFELSDQWPYKWSRPFIDPPPSPWVDREKQK